MTEQQDRVTVRMTVRDWATVDAELDNTSSGSRVDGPQGKADLADAIRDAGRVQVPWQGQDWPPMSDWLDVTLSRSQWAFALAEVEGSISVYEELDDQESADLGRAAAAAIRSAGA